MFGGHHRQTRVLFGLSDIVLIALAFQLAYATRSQLDLGHNFFISSPEKPLLMGWCIVVWIALAYWFELYDHIDSSHPRTILRDVFRQCLLGVCSMILFEYALRLDLSRLFVGLFTAYLVALLCVFRLNAGNLLRVVRREFGSPRYMMIAGLGETALRLGREIENASAYGLRLTGFLAESGSADEVQLAATYPVRLLSDLPDILKKHVIDEIIFAVDTRRLPELEEIFLLCDEEGIRTRVAVDFFPHLNSEVYVERLGAAPLLTFSSTPHDEIRLLIKRLTDIVLGGAALIVLTPVMLAIALVIRLTSPGPAIFRQVRCGLNGRTFMFYKFRSMQLNAHEMRESLRHLSQRDLAMKIPNDPRLTGVGRWLRKFSMDELPQLWNVVKGDMSLVGPRPAVPEEVEQYQRWQRRRLRMRPGLTCLWAVCGRDAVDFETWMKLDMQYIDSWSLALDWKIILRTIPQVLSGRGAH